MINLKDLKLGQPVSITLHNEELGETYLNLYITHIDPISENNAYLYGQDLEFNNWCVLVRTDRDHNITSFVDYELLL